MIQQIHILGLLRHISPSRVSFHCSVGKGSLCIKIAVIFYYRAQPRQRTEVAPVASEFHLTSESGNTKEYFILSFF